MIVDVLFLMVIICMIVFNVAKQKNEAKKEEERINKYRQFVSMYTDPILENRLVRQMEDPAQFDAIWSRIENYKSNNGLFYRQFSTFSTWQEVGLKRRPLTAADGSIYGRTKSETEQLKLNRRSTLVLLMHTYEKIPQAQISSTFDLLCPIGTP